MTRFPAIALLWISGLIACQRELAQRPDDTVDVCAELATLTDELLACLSPTGFLYDSYRKVGELARSDRSDPTVVPHLMRSCAGYLETFSRSPSEYPAPCEIKPLSPTVRAQIHRLRRPTP